MSPASLISAVVLAAAGASAAAAQSGCNTVTLSRDNIQSAQLQLFAPAAQPSSEPEQVIDREAAPASFDVVDCGQPYLLWRRDGGPFVIERTKIDPAALGDETMCRCPEDRGGAGRDGAAPGLGVKMCPVEECS